MKKIISVLLSVTILLGLLPIFPVNAIFDTSRFTSTSLSDADVYSFLLNNWFQNNIQCECYYRFNDDGTCFEYYGDFSGIVDYEHIYYNTAWTYSVRSGKVVIDVTDGYSVSLSVLNNISEIPQANLDRGILEQLIEIPEKDQFLYELNWSSGASTEDYSNALYMRPIALVSTVSPDPSFLSILVGTWQLADAGKYVFAPDGTYELYQFDIGPDGANEILAESGTIRFVNSKTGILNANGKLKELNLDEAGETIGFEIAPLEKPWWYYDENYEKELYFKIADYPEYVTPIETDPATETEPQEENLPSSFFLRAYSRNSSFTVECGKELYFEIRLIKDGNIVHEWDAPALTISDYTIVDANIGGFHNYAYIVHLTAKKAGISKLVLSDSTSGAFLEIPITVYSLTDGIYSFSMSSVPEFYPTVYADKAIKTNFYDVGGIYINNYSYTTEKNEYHVKFDAYNSGFCHGAVDVYDENGEWIDSYTIKKFSDVSGLSESYDYIVKIVQGARKDGVLAYTSEAMATHTPIEFDLPKGGSFTISNSIRYSPGTFISNIIDFFVLGLTTAIDCNSDIEISCEKLTDKIVKEAITDKAVYDAVFDCMQEMVFDTVKDGITKDMARETMKDLCTSFLLALEEKTNLNINNLLGNALNVSESLIEAAGGPSGWFLKLFTEYMDRWNYIMQVMDMLNNADLPPIRIQSMNNKGPGTIDGVTVETDGAIPEEAILQAFRVYTLDIEELTGENKKLKKFKYEVYNICFVTEDTTVSPDGKVTVKIKTRVPIQGEFYVYRQEKDGTWTEIPAGYSNGSVVFETEHFSNYAIFYQDSQIISSDVDETGDMIQSTDPQEAVGTEESNHNSKRIYFLFSVLLVILVCAVLVLFRLKKKKS